MAQQTLKCHTAAILLGGHSSRMGGMPKFTLQDRDGRFYLEKQIQQLEKFQVIYLSAADEKQLEQIKEFDIPENCLRLTDIIKNCGPLGGLYTILQQLKSEDEWIFVTACDMPELTEAMVNGLVQKSEDAYEQGYDCIVYQDSRSRLHPLCGLYRTSLLPVIRQMMQYKDYKIMNLLIRSRCLVVQASEMGISDDYFVNINTPGEYERWKNSSSNRQKGPKIVCICGIKNSGKTTYIEKLISSLTAAGRKVSVIKHDGHDFDGDRPGTDTYRYHQAGAAQTAIFSRNRFMMNADTTVSLQYLAHQFSDADVILVEGMKQSILPKIEIVRQGISDELSCNQENLIAVVTDIEKEFDGVTKWPLDDCSYCTSYLIDG